MDLKLFWKRFFGIVCCQTERSSLLGCTRGFLGAICFMITQYRVLLEIPHPIRDLSIVVFNPGWPELLGSVSAWGPAGRV